MRGALLAASRGDTISFNRSFDMTNKKESRFPFPPKRVYLGEKVPRWLIRRYANAIAAEFHPDKIILFGSYANGTPHADSDVDLLVVMPTRNPHDQAVRIQYRLTAPFPVDLIVRTPEQTACRLEERDPFLTRVMSQGKVLYEKDHAGVSQEGLERVQVRGRQQPPCAGPPGCERRGESCWASEERA